MTTDIEDLWAARGERSSVGADQATEDRLLEATDRLVRQVGMSKISMAEVARSAGVARGTLYRYFESREVLLEALRRRTTEWFFAEVAEEMDRFKGLSAQLGTFAEILTHTINARDDQQGSTTGQTNRATIIHILGTQGAQALSRTSTFLRPYLEAALRRGEISADIDVAEASTWMARVLLSFSVFQQQVGTDADVAAAGRFVRRYAINGLSGV